MKQNKFMAEIKIKKQKEAEDSWRFEVEIKEEDSQTTHFVTVDKDYFTRFSGKFSLPEELVKKSFEFLLEHEPKESILSEFNISVIKTYFPEYEEEIKK